MIDREDRVWYEIDGFPNYRVSDDHIVQNKRTKRVLKQCDNNSGYPSVCLYNENGRSPKMVHRLVAEAAVDGYEEGLVVNHKNGDKHDNRPSNLEWVTPSENEIHAHKTGLKYGPNRIPVRVIETGEVFKSIRDCAKAIGSRDSNVRRVLSGECRTTAGLSIEYATPEEVNAYSYYDNKTKDATVQKPYRRPVRVVETNTVYTSSGECARAIGGDQGTIIACLKGRHKTHHGYHYEYAD